MSSEVSCPHVGAVLSKLKDFQRDTVNYVFQRMYEDADHTRRFLIADEVGLGKTLVARGLVARVIDYLWDRVPRIDVIYICSNAEIARQNIARLRIGDQKDFALPSRITLLPTAVKDLQRNKLNFISFTPGTSFDLKSSLGIAEERVLLFWLLSDAWSLTDQGSRNVFQGWVRNKDYFRGLIEQFPASSIDVSLKADFLKKLEQRLAADRQQGKRDLRSRFDELRRRFRQHTSVKGQESEQADVIGDLRALLAATCLKAIEPDLVILDEFQRFKHLLEGRDDAARLARDLFEFEKDGSDFEKNRVLLLSATPYKMYTVADEADTDDHYEDFLRTMHFLQNDPSETQRVEQLLREYRLQILRLGDGSADRLLDLKSGLEARMRRVMVRTERLAVTEDRDGMLRTEPSRSAKLRASDLHDYATVQHVARSLGVQDTLEYWKSSPYILNFMREYHLKRALKGCSPTLRAELLGGAAVSMLDWEKVSRYEPIDPANARLRALMADTIETGAWQLLWITPSLPYYRPQGPFAEPALQRFTKRLVFSCWDIVPRAIAALLSYEAERNIFKSFDQAIENRPDAQHRRTRLLQFTQNDGRLTGMPLIGLIYPSLTLAQLCDPFHVSTSLTDTKNELPTLEQVLRATEARIADLLAKVHVDRSEGSAEDESWYWAAPILLDQTFDSAGTNDWLSRQDLATTWASDQRADRDGAETHWVDHVKRVQELATGVRPLGPKPRDLLQVLALQAVAAPGNVALRALARASGGNRALEMPVARDHAAQVARAFLHLFNLPEASALLRGRDRREPYWQRVLEYCAAGNLQATLDEYAHILRDSLGLFDADIAGKARDIAGAMCNALDLRTAALQVDDLSPDAQGSEPARRRMRARFALRFGEESVDGSSETNRADLARAAFNSPFWPFVLATTSVGQEGLDFHHYCHAVVHWNLPSNPVDLEQREGRVHRFKGHAVRRNLALHHGLPAAASEADPWEALFQRAASEKQAGDNDLVPYWVYPVPDGAVIQRHVFALPLSRDMERFNSLRKSLAVYRMVFGQPRQDDLLAFLIGRLPESEIARVTSELRIDLSPSRSSPATK